MPHRRTIMLIEDAEDDVLLLRRVLRQGGLPNPIIQFCSGEEAMAYLHGSGIYGNRTKFPLPHLILLDLTLPDLDSFHLLSWIRQQEQLRNVPVIVLAASTELRVLNQAYALGATSFVIKDFEFQKPAELTRFLRDYWLDRTQELPATPHA